MKKWSVSALWVMMLLAVSAVTAYADVAPEPPYPVPRTDTKSTVLIIAVVIIAAAIIAWMIIRSRRNKDDK